jgi:uncharacterized protein YbjT (DUF2867 family)
VQALRSRDARVVPIARSHGVDLFAGGGVDAALRGVSAVIDVSNVVTTKRNESVEFFTRATGNLLRACRLSGVERYILLSIVGIDDVPIGCYAGKRVQERLVTESGLTATVVRSTQFHEFAGQVLDRLSIGRVAVVPKLLSRPGAASAVADRLARIAVAPQPPAIIEIAGPECLCLLEMSRRLCRHQHDRMLLIPIRVPGKAGCAIAQGALLPMAISRWTSKLSPTGWGSSLAGDTADIQRDGSTGCLRPPRQLT